MGRNFLVALSLLSAVGGIAFAETPNLPLLAITAFAGMLNGTGTDRSAAYALDQAVVPELVPDLKRTWSLAWYNVLLDGGGSIGALGAGLPLLVQHHLSLSILKSYRLVFFGYSGLYITVAVLCSFLSPAVEVRGESVLSPKRTRIAPESKAVITKLTALFSLDAFGGGFLTDALVAYWFFRRFGIGEQNLGLVFFAVRVLNAVSHLGAAWLARHIGLVRYYGVHAFAIQPFPHGRTFRPILHAGSGALSLPGGIGGDGCPHSSVLRSRTRSTD